MYKCQNCGAQFDEPKFYKDCVGEFHRAPAYQTFYGCLICGCSYYVDETDFDAGR